MARPTKPVTIEITEPTANRLAKLITDYDFRFQVQMPDAAQRAADDLAIALPTLQRIVDAYRKEQS